MHTNVRKKNESIYYFHGLSETLLKFDLSDVTDKRELCFDTDVCGHDKRDPFSVGNKIFSSCPFNSSISLFVNCSRVSNVHIGPRLGWDALAIDWPIGGSCRLLFIDCGRLDFADDVRVVLGDVQDKGHEPVKRPRGNFWTAYFKPKMNSFFEIL